MRCGVNWRDEKLRVKRERSSGRARTTRPLEKLVRPARSMVVWSVVTKRGDSLSDEEALVQTSR